MGDNALDLTFAIFSGTLALLSIIGLIYIIVDEIIRFRRGQRRLEELKSLNDEQEDR